MSEKIFANQHFLHRTCLSIYKEFSKSKQYGNNSPTKMYKRLNGHFPQENIQIKTYEKMFNNINHEIANQIHYEILLHAPGQNKSCEVVQMNGSIKCW